MKSLIHNNIYLEAPSTYYGSITSVSCICGAKLNQYDLDAYFTHSEIEQIYDEIKAGRKSLVGEEVKGECVYCRERIRDSDGFEYACQCGVRAHARCAEVNERANVCPKCFIGFTWRMIPHATKEGLNRKWVLPCCKEEIEDKSIFINALIELNMKKMASNAERVICPFCSKTLGRNDMRKILTDVEIETILEGSSETECKLLYKENDVMMSAVLPVEVCSKCGSELSRDEPHITFECGHRYHTLCAKTVLELESYSYERPKCVAKNCGKTVYDKLQLIQKCKEVMGRNCVCCGESGIKFVLLECKHYVCRRCGENFRSGKNKYFTIKHSIITVDCRVCDEEEQAKQIVLQCYHTASFCSIRRRHTSLDYEEPRFLGCDECSCALNDVELYAVLGAKAAERELEKLDRYMSNNKKTHEKRKNSEDEECKASVRLKSDCRKA
eukprot:TRINITY_DN8765_c0_g1_i6.p1 TRINITY_DN8765_c0_g1~~TRINITY_DN8765_c0_g1_i6.p1  ORF type:complete len:441 (-),score=121.58 TRINITY_DN8765_c0_g1_i6:507-1829(-)